MEKTVLDWYGEGFVGLATKIFDDTLTAIVRLYKKTGKPVCSHQLSFPEHPYRKPSEFLSDLTKMGYVEAKKFSGEDRYVPTENGIRHCDAKDMTALRQQVEEFYKSSGHVVFFRDEEPSRIEMPLGDFDLGEIEKLVGRKLFEPDTVAVLITKD